MRCWAACIGIGCHSFVCNKKMWQYLEMTASTFNKLEHTTYRNVSFSRASHLVINVMRWNKTRNSTRILCTHTTYNMQIDRFTFLIALRLLSKRPYIRKWINFFQLICDYITILFFHEVRDVKRIELQKKRIRRNPYIGAKINICSTESGSCETHTQLNRTSN